MRAILGGLLALVWLLAVPPAWAIDNVGLIEDEENCKTAGVGVDGRALLDFFQRRTPDAASRQRLTQLIEQLDSNQFLVRQKASQRLSEVGPPALAALRQATRNNSLEMTRRAERCIEEIERASNRGLPGSAARLLRARKPDRSCAVLLAYLPYADDDAAEEEVVAALAVLGVRAGRLDPLLLEALTDAAPARRAAAAALVGRLGTADQKKDACRLLTDADPRVRLQAARGLIAGGDKKAVATLVGLVSGAPIDLAMEADDLLTRLAGGEAPVRLADATDAARRKCHEAWDTWWKANREKVDLARADQELFLDGSARARQVVRQNLTALFTADADTMKKTTDAPFQFSSSASIQTREELDKGIDWLCQILKDDRNAKQFEKVSMTVRQVVSAEAYQRTGKSTAISNFIAGVPKRSELRVVYVLLKGIDNPPEEPLIVVVVRVASGSARVIGLDGDADRR